MEWKEVTLGEIGTIVGGATPSTKSRADALNILFVNICVVQL